ncbi:hypothetical protein IPH92_02050 [Candidatus Kaiserbacteria bacterium]|nr:MAG: hypothetical protein IPH92_02050 [Candidatus Kaiserbacteria bacterium]
MNKIIILVGLLGVIGLGYSLWVLSPNELPKPPNGSVSTFPVASSTTGTTETPINQEEQTKRVAIKSAFEKQVVTPLPITLGYTIIVSNYALQEWDDGYSAGESVFVYTAEKGWTVIPEAAVVWSVENLVSVGVPELVAREIIIKRKASQGY